MARRKKTRPKAKAKAKAIAKKARRKSGGRAGKKAARKPAKQRRPKRSRKPAAARRPVPPVARAGESPEQEALQAKFELAPPQWTRELDELDRAQSIPWGYGRDKVTAMAVDPERLFMYWEVTDAAIARARERLGAAGEDAGLDLRVHDVTGLLFDGDNSHHHFDVGVARGDRQWFAHVGRPGSTVVVELGLCARDGAFAPISRSHRVDFPRRTPAPAGPVEWLTVTPARPDGVLDPGPTGAAWDDAPEGCERPADPARVTLEPAGVGIAEAPHGSPRRTLHSTWRVEILGPRPRGGTKSLARWEVRRAFVSETGGEQRLGGASELCIGGASELRLGGASEAWPPPPSVTPAASPSADRGSPPAASRWPSAPAAAAAAPSAGGSRGPSPAGRPRTRRRRS